MMIIMCTELRAFNQTIIAIVLCPEAGIHWAQKRIGYKWVLGLKHVECLVLCIGMEPNVWYVITNANHELYLTRRF